MNCLEGMNVNNQRIFSIKLLFLLLALIPLFIGFTECLNKDLWWDEIISLKDYALVSLKTTTTLYPDPNNHIFFNLINNVFTNVIGKRDFFDALDGASWLRLIQFCFSFITLSYLYRISKRFFSKETALISVLILTTSIPFLNYFMQLRGYNLSMMFVIISLYHIWAFETIQNKKDAVAVILSIFLLFYTMPSNAYYIISIITIYIIKWLRSIVLQRKSFNAMGKKARRKVHSQSFFKNRRLLILIWIGLGVSTGLLAYLPVLDAVLHNRFVENTPPVREFVLTNRLPNILHHFLSFRYLLLIPFVLGMISLVKDKTRSSGEPAGISSYIGQLWILLLLPFIIAFMREDMPFQRSFIHVLPIFSMLFAAGITAGFDNLRIKKKIKPIVSILCLVYTLGTFFYARTHVKNRLTADLQKAKKSQNIYFNYYQSDKYNPDNDLKILFEHHQREPGTILFSDEIDRVAAHYYLNKYNLDHFATVNIKAQQNVDQRMYQGLFQKSRGPKENPAYFRLSFPGGINEQNKKFTPLFMYLLHNKPSSNSNDPFYVVTAFANKFKRIMSTYHSDIQVRMLNPRPSYHSIFLLNIETQNDS